MSTEATPGAVPFATTMSEIPSRVGSALGPTAWRTVTQEQVSEFADLTDDHNPIHIDPDFAKGTPFGGTIAHGFFTLSLLASLMAELLAVDGAGLSINYGFEKVRFPAPVPVGSEIRASGEIAGVEEVPGGVQVKMRVAVEVKGQDKPAVVADWLLRHYA